MRPEGLRDYLLFAGLVVATPCCEAVLCIEAGELASLNDDGGGEPSGGFGGSGGSTSVSCPYFAGIAPDDCQGGSAYLSDAENCCVSDRSCQGAACVAGSCQPKHLTSYASALNIIAAGDYLVWSTPWGTPAAIHQANKNGKDLKLLAEDLDKPHGLATDGEYVYWTQFDGSEVRRVPLSGGSSQLGATVPGATASDGEIEIRDGLVFWATVAGSPQGVWLAHTSGTGGSGGSPAAPIEIWRDDVGGPKGVAVDAEYVYWSQPGSGGNIWRRKVSSAGELLDVAEKLVSAEDVPQQLVVHDDMLYWLAGDTVRTVHKDGGAASTLAASQQGPRQLIADDAFVYWTTCWDTCTGSLRKVPVTGGVVSTLVQDSRSPNGLTQDCETIYFVYRDSAEISLVAK